MYAYVDESYQAGQFIGYGMFVTPYEKIDWLPDKNILKNTRNKKSYFHATDDDYHVREMVIKTINENASGAFYFFYIKDLDASSEGQKEQTLDELLAWIYLNQTPSTKLFIEQRTDINQEKLQKTFMRTKDVLLNTTIDNPYICKPLYYINTEVVDKNNPGITIVDYLAWTCNRKLNIAQKIENKDYYFNTIKWTKNLPTCDVYPIANGTGYIERHLGNYYNKDHKWNYPYNPLEIKLDDCRIEHPQLATGHYNEIERLIEIIVNQKPPILDHFNDEFQKYCEYKNSKNHKDIIIQSCKLFILCCDTLPIWRDINKTDTQRWKDFLQLKYMAYWIYNSSTTIFVYYSLYAFIRNRANLKNTESLVTV